MTLLELAERFEAKSKAVCRIECAPEYHAYWRGYSQAMEEAADFLRSQSKQASTK